MKLPNWIREAITEPDNKTTDPVRLLAITGSIQYLGMGLAHYVQHHIFDPQGFAVGFGALLGGVGVALGMKKDTKPEEKK
jgi:hypothetical protein